MELLHLQLQLLQWLQEFILLLVLRAAPVLDARRCPVTLQILIELFLLIESRIRMLCGHRDHGCGASRFCLTFDRSHEEAPLLRRTARVQLSVDVGERVLPTLVHQGTDCLGWALAAVLRTIFAILVEHRDHFG